MNRLRAYVRRTILRAARDYSGGKCRTPDSTRAAFRDALRGTDTGWWTDLIFTAPMLDMAHRYRRCIAAALAEYHEATGESVRGADFDAAQIATSLLYGRVQWRECCDSNTLGRIGDAQLAGLRFAVEWYAGELAREYCPDL